MSIPFIRSPKSGETARLSGSVPGRYAEPHGRCTLPTASWTVSQGVGFSGGSLPGGWCY